MKKNTNITKKLMEKAALSAAKTAAGSASSHIFHQPKEPKNLKMLLSK